MYVWLRQGVTHPPSTRDNDILQNIRKRYYLERCYV